jgi:tetratricopeptide (TPR) repeat protein
MNRCILFLALCIIAQTSWSQPLRSVTYEMMIETAEEQLALGNLYDALDWYEQAYDENREDDLAYQIAWLNYQLRDFRRAETLFDRLLRRDREGKYPLARYYRTF